MCDLQSSKGLGPNRALIRGHVQIRHLCINLRNVQSNLTCQVFSNKGKTSEIHAEPCWSATFKLSEAAIHGMTIWSVEQPGDSTSLFVTPLHVLHCEPALGCSMGTGVLVSAPLLLCDQKPLAPEQGIILSPLSALGGESFMSYIH